MRGGVSDGGTVPMGIFSTQWLIFRIDSLLQIMSTSRLQGSSRVSPRDMHHLMRTPQLTVLLLDPLTHHQSGDQAENEDNVIQVSQVAFLFREKYCFDDGLFSGTRLRHCIGITAWRVYIVPTPFVPQPEV